MVIATKIKTEEMITMKKTKTNEKKKTTLRKQIILVVVSLISGIAIISGILSAYFSSSSTSTCLEQSMTSTAQVAAQSAENRIGKYSALVQNITSDSILYSETSTKEEKLANLSSSCKSSSDFVRISFFTPDGISLSDGNDGSSSESFQKAAKGETCVSSSFIDEATGECVISISSPVWKNGMSGSAVVGVVNVLVRQEAMLNTMVEDINISSRGDTYIIDKDGNTIADTDVARVTEKENIIENAKSDSRLKQLADIYSKVTAGETGFCRYPYEGVNMFVAYAPIQGTDNWSLLIEAPVSDFTQGVRKSILATVIIVVLSITTGTLFTIKLAKALSVPLTSIMDRLTLFAEGDVSSPVPQIKTTTLELDNLKAAFVRTTEYTNEVITDIDNLLAEMSQGNFTVDSGVPEKYIGDYASILDAFKLLKSGLSESFENILKVSEQVSESSLMISSGAQSLAQGSTEQASSIQELSSSISEISQRINQNAEDSEKAKTLTTDAEQIMQSSTQDMKLALQAMDEISATSNDISKVIKAIDSIAFQTNILALNAAVEAARAGSAGKGFAVVADEVRNLSQKSAEAAKNTTALIENTIAAVEKGSQLVSKTGRGFNEVAIKSTEVEKLVEAISVQAQEQAAEVSQISAGIEQVASVVQMNSATSEESAAASEELSSQADLLKALVQQFKLDRSQKSE